MNIDIQVKLFLSCRRLPNLPLFSFYFIGGIDMEYNISPDFPNSVWNAASVVLAILGGFGIASNLTIIVTYLRNNSVSACFILISK